MGTTFCYFFYHFSTSVFRPNLRQILRVKTILIFGAGKSASVLIQYLLQQSESRTLHIIVADANRDLVLLKTKNHPNSTALGLNIEDDQKRQELIQKADVVISMMPAVLHLMIAKDCLTYKKNLLTASYVDKDMETMKEAVKDAGLSFLCEMGLDPGIDHMSAMKVIHHLKSQNANIISFKSHCGGLVAPVSDNNPWHYKISWNPRNVVNAGKAGAIYKEAGLTKSLDYKNLFDANNIVNVEGQDYSFYYNRDSLSYIPKYNLEGTETFMRTTLRFPDFMKGWKHVVDLQLTSENFAYQTNGMSMRNFYATHLQNHFPQLSQDDLKNLDDGLFLHLMDYLGWNDDSTIINQGNCSSADIMQFALEHYLKLLPGDKDRVVMLHEFEYVLNDKKYYTSSSLVVDGEDDIMTAMAKTVGMPLAVGALLLLDEIITVKGVHIPILPEIYEPVLDKLQKIGIEFKEETKSL